MVPHRTAPSQRKKTLQEQGEKHLATLPKRQEFIAYYRGEYCVLTLEEAAALRKRGFSARLLEEGFPERRTAELPVETSES